MRKLLLLLIISTLPLTAQVQDTSKAYDYPYKLPIWGQKAADRGIKLQLPYGLNINYIYNQMDLEIDNFGMSVGDNPNSGINQAIDKYINAETLNFQETKAITNGVNVRADVWVLPFLNFYGIYAKNNGQTSVSLQPRWYDDNNDLVLELPEFSSTVDFDANSVGLGSTIVYGIDNYFASVDANYTLSFSEILEDPAKLMVASARVGTRHRFKNDMHLAVYVGGMYRGFVEAKGNYGAITLEQAIPEIGQNILPKIDNQMSENQDAIDALNPNNPIDKIQIEALEKKNEVLGAVSNTITEVIDTDINYEIKKDIINNWTVQFGFNMELSENWTFRGEYGVGTGNIFVLTGLQYRFGM